MENNFHYKKENMAVVNPVIEVDELVAKMLHDILQQACWDLGKIKDDSQSNVKHVDPVRVITLGDGFHNVAFLIRIRRNGDPKCYG